MSDIRLKLAPPWITFINEIQALFDGDPQIACNIDWQKPSIVLATNNGDKVAALIKILPTERTWGNITLTIAVDGTPSNIAFKSNKELYETAFKGNPAFAYCVAPAEEGYYFMDFVYVVFKCCVVQFFNDNLNDAHGIISTLYEDIASDIFDGTTPSGVNYCTDVEHGKLGMPLGEWP